MKLIVWKSSYEGGNPEIDQQHQKLVEIINDLHDAMMLGKGMQIMNQILESLIAYTAFHFDAEEKWMADNRYAHVSEHNVLHEKLTSQVLIFKEEFESNALSNTVRANNFLKTWLTDHILEEDLKVMKSLRK